MRKGNPSASRRDQITKNLERHAKGLSFGGVVFLEANCSTENTAFHSYLPKSPIMTALSLTTNLISMFCFGLCHMTFSHCLPITVFFWAFSESWLKYRFHTEMKKCLLYTIFYTILFF